MISVFDHLAGGKGFLTIGAEISHHNTAGSSQSASAKKALRAPSGPQARYFYSQ